MKKVVIVGSGAAGLISAAFMHRFWDDNVQIKLIYDKNNKNIAVGESTTPIIHKIIDLIGLDLKDIFDIGTTVKLGVNFKDWILDSEYFHGFREVDAQPEGFFANIRSDETSAIYSILNDCFNGGPAFSKPHTTLPSLNLNDYGHAFHIDTQKFLDLLFDFLQRKIEFIDDIVENVNVDGQNIVSIECKNNGIINGDFFVDASGFNCVLFKHLNPKWIDTSSALPLNRAIPQQVPNDMQDLPAYTLSQATKNGWIWRIPIGDRFGTGYLYSSKFTSDEEAREEYNSWLVDNFDIKLHTDRIIKYNPGYYYDNCIGNCLAVGLSAGFVEPLESTSIHLIADQIYHLLVFDSNLNNLPKTIKHINQLNRETYEEIVNFLCLHYAGNRTDSKFWEYMTNNKIEWVKDFEEKCAREFLDASVFDNKRNTVWAMNSYVQVAHGLNLFNKDSIREFLEIKPNGQAILDYAEEIYDYEEKWKNDRDKFWVSHERVLEQNK